MSAEQRVSTPRGRRGGTAVVVAIIGVLVAAFAALQAISLARHGHTVGFHAAPVLRYLTTTRVRSHAVLIVGIVAAAVGLVLVALALVPARRRQLELEPTDPLIATGLDRGTLRNALAAAAETVDGVTRARTAGHRQWTVSVRTALRDPSLLESRVQESVASRLADLRLRRPRTVRVVLDRADTDTHRKEG